MYVIGGIEDQIAHIVWSSISRSPFEIANSVIENFPQYSHTFNSLLHPWISSQPLTAAFLSLSLSLGGAHTYNLLLLLTILANVAGSYLFFRKFKYGLWYSLIFSFSAFLWIHLGTHFELMQLWIFPVFLYVLSKVSDKRLTKAIPVTGLYIALSVLISNYLGYFLLLFFTVFVFFHTLLGYLVHKRINTREVKFFFGSILLATSLIFVTMLPYFRANYSSSVSDNPLNAGRGLEDFITFSSRPWYFFLPSTKNPWLGETSAEIYNRISATNYFLADDYFPGEHSSSYFGLAFIFVTASFSVYVLKKGDRNSKRAVLIYLLTAVVLFLFTFPPYFTISGITIYTPSFLLFKLFPMFRTLTRLSVVIHLCLILMLAHSTQLLYYRSSKKDKLLLNIFIPFLVVVTFFETFVTVKVQKHENPPAVYTYMNQTTPSYTEFAVYPYSRAEEAFFWLPSHERLLINPRMYMTKDFDSEVFTKNLISPEGLDVLRGMENAYLVVHKDIPPEETEFFLENLNLIKEFETHYLFSPR